MKRGSEMREEGFFFGEEGRRLFGVRHRPRNDGGAEALVMISPFAEEKLWAHRVFVSFARELAQRGVHVLRFDFLGHGDSDGDFENTDVDSRLSDISQALAALREGAPSVTRATLLGLRFGATLAALAAEQAGGVDRLVLWEPITSGGKYMQEVLRANLATQMRMYKEIRHNREALVERLERGETVNYDGYEIGHSLYRQASAVDLLEGERAFGGECMVVQIGRGRGKVRKSLESLAGKYRGCEASMAEEECFWRDVRLYCTKADNLFDATLSWLGLTGE